jgi:hypothetical protein
MGMESEKNETEEKEPLFNKPGGVVLKRKPIKIKLKTEQAKMLHEVAIGLGLRHGGAKWYKRSPNGFANEYILNTKNYAKVLKQCIGIVYKELPDLLKYREIQKIEREAEEKKRSLGLGVKT